MKPISVNELNIQLKSLVESTFSRVLVQGELGRVTYHTSGHIYFSIKDDKSTIDCVLFRGNAAKLKFRLENGQKVVVDGGVTIYAPQGRYQINCFAVEPSGAGSLALAYEQLKKKLADQGYFDESRKKPLPIYPKTVALITSATGAALQDMLNTAKRRWQLTKLICVDTLVQGEMAAQSIVNSIKYADNLGVDAIVLARGGGSMEDLWCFNDEAVADAIFTTKTPTISAIGHEIDVVISDFVADKRAATPTASMEILLPDINDERFRLDQMSDELNHRFLTTIQRKSSELKSLKEGFLFFSFDAKIARNRAELNDLKAQLNRAYKNTLDIKALDLSALKERFLLQNPATKIPAKTAQITKSGKIVTVADLKKDDEITLLDSTHKATAKIVSSTKI